MEMLQSLWNHEIDHINGLTTYKYAQRLNSKEHLEVSKAMFHIAGRCIEEAKKGQHDDPAGGKLICLDGHCTLKPLDSTSFLSIAPGNLYFTMDQPFILSMAANEYLQQDAGDGIKVYYCIQYNMSGTKDFMIDKASLVFAQHTHTKTA